MYTAPLTLDERGRKGVKEREGQLRWENDEAHTHREREKKEERRSERVNGEVHTNMQSKTLIREPSTKQQNVNKK